MKACTACRKELPLDRFYADRRTLSGLCAECKECKNERVKKYNKAHPEQRKAVAAKANRKQYANRRQLVLDAYGRECRCCGVQEEIFLTIDHMSNDGAAHRAEIGGTAPFYGWLIKNNYPEGFQTLCWNCNWAKHRGGCPHQGLVTTPHPA